MTRPRLQYPSQERLREIFDYSSSEGMLIRKITDGRGAKPTGINNKKDYRRTYVNSKHYCHHRLVWIWHHGAVNNEILVDHINRDRHDDRIENLRLATASENNAHRAMSPKNTSGFKGVIKEHGRWRVQCSINGKRAPYRSFATKEEATACYQKAAAELHGEFAGAFS